MKTRYPIEYRRGKLVKHLKPYKNIRTLDILNYSLYGSSGIKLSVLVDWVKENDGNLEDVELNFRVDWNNNFDGEVCLIKYLSKEEISKQEKDYDKLLKEWEEWKELSKTAKDTEEVKNKQIRAKALKTQENNLLAKLRRIREQQDKI